MIYLTFGLFLLFVFFGIPIVFALGLTSLAYIFLTDSLQMLLNVPQRMIIAVDSFSLIAIPLFILVGELMNIGGITKRIIDFFRSLLGHVHGGIAYVNIITSGFLSSIVGSSNAVAAITSKSLVPEMERDGYSKEYASSVSAASSIMGPIIPPSMIFILYGIAASVSIGKLFIAGIVPGLLLLIFFCLTASFYARKYNVPTKERASLQETSTKFLQTIPSLLIPAVILGGILSGVFTATEAGAIGSLLAFILGVFIYKEIKFKDLPEIIIRTGIVTASILIIASTATLFGWILAMERIPQLVAEALLTISSDPLVLLLIINILLLIVGCFLEPFAAILILVPVLLPVIKDLGIDPIHFGVIISLNLTIGLITPPVGLTLFIVSGITRVSLTKLTRALLPYLAASLIVLLIVTYWPSLIMFLPNLYGQ